MPDESGGGGRVDDIIPPDFFPSHQAGINERPHVAIGNIGEPSGLGQGNWVAYCSHDGIIPTAENVARPILGGVSSAGDKNSAFTIVGSI